MANVIERSTGWVPGVWLLGQAELKDLDLLLEDEWQRLEERRKSQIDNAVKREMRDLEGRERYKRLSDEGQEAERKAIRPNVKDRYPHKCSLREVTLTFRSGKKASAAKLADLLAGTGVSGEFPQSLKVNFESGAASLVMELESKVVTPGAYVRAFPTDTREAQECYARCAHWLEQNRAGWWPCFWNRHFLLAWFLFWIGLAALSFLFTIGQGENRHKAEARELLARGLKKEDERRALELALAILAGHDPGSKPAPSLWWLFGPMLVGLAACGALSFVPRTIIGVGKGQGSLERWKWWVRFSQGVPLFLFGSLVVPMLRELVKFW